VEKQHESVCAEVRTARAWDVLMFELAGGEPGLCKELRGPELQYRDALDVAQVSRLAWLGCDLKCVWAGEFGSVCTSLCRSAL